jgi:hypothetical protein
MKRITIGDFDYTALAGYPTNRATLLVSRNGLDLAASKVMLHGHEYKIVEGEHEVIIIPSCIGKDIYDKHETEWSRGLAMLVEAINS